MGLGDGLEARRLRGKFPVAVATRNYEEVGGRERKALPQRRES